MSIRWRIVVSFLLLALIFVGTAARFLSNGRHPSPPDTTVTGGGYNARSEPATLQEVLESARRAVADIEQNVHDYSGFILKRERVGSQIVKTWMFIKFRDKPFSVYLYYPDSTKLDGSNESNAGREVIYVEGRNDDQLLVHTPGLILGALGTIQLAPNSFLALKGERHPITDIGLANLCRQLIQRGEAAGDPAKVQVKRFPHARINSRACSLLEVVYPSQEKEYSAYLARIFVDNEWHFPTRVEVYGLPREGKPDPQLVEEYTYLDLKLNNGYTDADFDSKNRQYHFPP